MNKTNYLYRPDDFQIFQRIGTTDKFTHIENIKNGFSGNKHSEDLLISLGFVQCSEEDFPGLENLQRNYLKELRVRVEPDGHGGIKGG